MFLALKILGTLTKTFFPLFKVVGDEVFCRVSRECDMRYPVTRETFVSH